MNNIRITVPCSFDKDGSIIRPDEKIVPDEHRQPSFNGGWTDKVAKEKSEARIAYMKEGNKKYLEI